MPTSRQGGVYPGLSVRVLVFICYPIVINECLLLFSKSQVLDSEIYGYPTYSGCKICQRRNFPTPTLKQISAFFFLFELSAPFCFQCLKSFTCSLPRFIETDLSFKLHSTQNSIFDLIKLGYLPSPLSFWFQLTILVQSANRSFRLKMIRLSRGI